MTFHVDQYVSHARYGVARVDYIHDGALVTIAPIIGRREATDDPSGPLPWFRYVSPADLSEAGRYYVKTGYHYWEVIDRATERAVTSVSARGKGDKRARSEARETCDTLNARHNALVSGA